MASTGGRQASDLAILDTLKQNPQPHRLFDVLRALERIYSDKSRLGASLRPSLDPVMLRQQPSLAFANATISRFVIEDGRPELYNLAYGIFGPSGPQPLHITEYAFERERHYDDETLSRFADVFHHRSISLLYRVWANTQAAVEMDRPEQNAFNRYMSALAGVYDDSFYEGYNASYSDPSYNNSLHNDVDTEFVSDSYKHQRFYHAGLFNSEVRSADGLATLLTSVFEVPVKVKQFVGGWLALEQSNQFFLADEGSYYEEYDDCSASPGSFLGQNTYLGERVYDCQNKFSLEVGVIHYESFVQLLPHTPNYNNLFNLISEYLGITFDWDLNFCVDAKTIPEWRLGEHGEMGWDIWLGNCQKNDEDGVIHVHFPSRNAAAYEAH